jgi:hypothetical protein
VTVLFQFHWNLPGTASAWVTVLIPFFVQRYHCHQRNCVIFCFFKDRVFITCMDDNCRRRLAAVRVSYYTMIRVLEEDVFACAAAAPSSSSSSGGSLYTLSSPTVRAVLSKDQMDELERLRDRVQGLVSRGPAQKPVEDNPGCTSARLFNIREVCKVPWRNIYVSHARRASKDERTWVEISEPMMGSYEAWLAAGANA